MTPRAKKQAAAPEERPPVQLTDPRDIRALAHPARLAVIDELYSGRELTATECAAIAGLSPSAMSYHLRSLERAGIVERVESRGDGRERPWRAAGSYLQVESHGHGAGDLAASAALNASVMGRTLEQFDAWQARRNREPEEWVDAAGASYGQLWVLPQEAKDIEAQMLEITEKYRGRRGQSRPAGARRVRFAVMVFPSDDPESGGGTS